VENLEHLPGNILEKKKQKFGRVLAHAKSKFEEFQKGKTILGIEERKKIITSHYE
jgi:hypothetical protein